MNPNRGGIRIAVVCGSVRPGNYTRMAVDVVAAPIPLVRTFGSISWAPRMTLEVMVRAG